MTGNRNWRSRTGSEFLFDTEGGFIGDSAVSQQSCYFQKNKQKIVKNKILHNTISD